MTSLVLSKLYRHALYNFYFPSLIGQKEIYFLSTSKRRFSKVSVNNDNIDNLNNNESETISKEQILDVEKLDGISDSDLQLFINNLLQQDENRSNENSNENTKENLKNGGEKDSKISERKTVRTVNDKILKKNIVRIFNDKKSGKNVVGIIGDKALKKNIVGSFNDKISETSVVKTISDKASKKNIVGSFNHKVPETSIIKAISDKASKKNITEASCDNISEEIRNEHLDLFINKQTDSVKNEMQHFTSKQNNEKGNLSKFLNIAMNTKSLEILQKILIKEKQHLNAEICSLSLERLAALAFLQNRTSECKIWFEMNLMEHFDKIYSTEDVNLKFIIIAVNSLVNIGLHETHLCKHLLKLIDERYNSSFSSVPIAIRIKFLKLVKADKAFIDISKNLSATIERSVFLQMNEIKNASSLLTLLLNVPLTDLQLKGVLERSKQFLSKMSCGELISILSNLSERKLWHVDIIPLIVAALQLNTSTLTANQISNLSHAVVALNYFDNRLLHRIATDITKKICNVTSWSTVSNILASFCKFRFIDEAAVNVLVDWINTKYEIATDTELSFALTAAVNYGIGDRILNALQFSAKIASIESAKSPSIWLNRIHALTMGKALTSRLAETVLRMDFVSHLLQETNPPKKLLLLTKLAQIQCSALCELSDFRGQTLELFDMLKLYGKEVALEMKYGRKKIYDAQCFHDLLYKLAPLDTHAFAPAVNEDGIFIDAILKMDMNERFVPINKFSDIPEPPIAIVYLANKHLMFEKFAIPRPLFTFCLRLLTVKGSKAVIFTEPEIKAHTTFTGKLNFIRKKISVVSNQKD